MKTFFLCLFFLPNMLFAQILLPGDANNDGRVDHIDVLAIGLSFGQEGPPREPPFQNINWSPKPFELWPGALPGTAVNHGFSDCDGSGFINEDDMAALKLNYDSMHQASQPPPMPYAPPDTFFSSALPRLVFQFNKDTATVQDTLLLSISYEHPPGLPAGDAPLGVAFTLEFNEMLIKDSLTQVFFEPSADDLLFAAGAAGFADARAVPPGRVEFGTAGKGQPGLPFTRPLGVVQFIVEDIIVRADTFFTELKIDISRPIMINLKEQIMRFEIVVDDIVLFQELSSTPNPLQELDVRLYPSPALDWLRIETPETPLAEVQVFNTMGQLISSQELNGLPQIELSTQDWLPGWYFLKLLAVDGRVTLRKVVKR